MDLSDDSDYFAQFLFENGNQEDYAVTGAELVRYTLDRNPGPVVLFENEHLSVSINKAQVVRMAVTEL